MHLFYQALFTFAFSTLVVHASPHDHPTMTESLYRHFDCQALPTTFSPSSTAFSLFFAHTLSKRKYQSISSPQSGVSKRSSCDPTKTQSRYDSLNAEAILCEALLDSFSFAIAYLPINDADYYANRIANNPKDPVAQFFNAYVMASCYSAPITILFSAAIAINPLIPIVMAPGITYAATNRFFQSYKAYAQQNNKSHATMHACIGLILIGSGLIAALSCQPL